MSDRLESSKFCERLTTDDSRAMVGITVSARPQCNHLSQPRARQGNIALSLEYQGLAAPRDFCSQTSMRRYSTISGVRHRRKDDGRARGLSRQKISAQHIQESEFIAVGSLIKALCQHLGVSPKYLQQRRAWSSRSGQPIRDKSS